MSVRSGIIKTLVILFLITGIFGGAAYFVYRLFEAPRLMVKKAMGAPAPTRPPDPSLAEYDRCLKVVQAGDLPVARKTLEDFVAAYPDSPRIDEARDTLGDINLKMFFSDAPAPDKQLYVIEKGDTISGIERKTKVSGELIMRLNHIDDPTKLRIGTVLNVTKPQFTLKIDHNTKRVVLLNHGKFFKQYKVEAWNAPTRKTAGTTSAKVVEKSAWEKNQRVPVGAKVNPGSGWWMGLSATGYTLYSDGATGMPKPEGGLGISVADMDELSTLINRGTPVIIE